MPATGGIATLSQVRSWNTDYLTEAADHWTRTAVVWEDSFTALANQISMPGGTRWEGAAADAAFASAHTDRMTVIGLADELHAAARVARTGANQIDSARSAVLRVVDAVEAADFAVGEDFSVTCPGLFDPVTAAARQAQAQAEAIATDLRATVGILVATDAEVASSLTAATGGLGTTLFPESGDAPGTVQLVDYKTAPPTEPGTSDDHSAPSEDGPAPAGSPQKSVTDELLRDMAEGAAPQRDSAADGLPGSLLPDKTDWILGGAGATGQTITDKVAELTRRSIANGGDGASPAVKKAVEEIKNPFTFLAKEGPSLGSKIGGGVGAILSIPAVAKDVGEDNMTAGHALAREGTGLVVGAAAGGLVSPVVGPVGAVGVGIVVGGAASKLADLAWEPLQEFGKAAADGGYRVARLGRP